LVAVDQIPTAAIGASNAGVEVDEKGFIGGART
jgi:hypothetical protein